MAAHFKRGEVRFQLPTLRAERLLLFRGFGGGFLSFGFLGFTVIQILSGLNCGAALIIRRGWRRLWSRDCFGFLVGGWAVAKLHFAVRINPFVNFGRGGAARQAQRGQHARAKDSPLTFLVGKLVSYFHRSRTKDVCERVG